MTKKIFLIFVFVFSLLLLVGSASAKNVAPQTGENLPEMELIKPDNKVHLKYLGLSGGGLFKINQIKAETVIIQIFSMYCPYCQADAPNINRLYKLILNNPRFKEKIKIIGIGAGNTSFEVNTFKNKYKVEFPLIPDADFKIHKIFGEVRTPYFIVVKLGGSKQPKVIYSKLGAHDDVKVFLDEIIKLSDIK